VTVEDAQLINNPHQLVEAYLACRRYERGEVDLTLQVRRRVNRIAR
jgi:hypothetical protein